METMAWQMASQFEGSLNGGSLGGHEPMKNAAEHSSMARTSRVEDAAPLHSVSND